jgi:hypothetical protein
MPTLIYAEHPWSFEGECKCEGKAERRDPKRYPPPPESLVGALHDRVKLIGPEKSRVARSCRVGAKKCKILHLDPKAKR